jgi:cobalt transporter subunit CbtA
MFRRIMLTALVAGALGGIFVWGVQLVTTTPLIAYAEQYEGGGEEAAHDHGANEETASEEATSEETSGHSHGGTWMPHDGLERHAFTLLSSVLMGVGFGFILTAVFALRGVDVDTRQGVLWGLGAFGALYVAPALGLPPELPGTMGADVSDRQLWWAGTAVATAIGLGLIVFGLSAVVRLAGILFMVIPHVIGAPYPVGYSESVPAELAAEFAVSSLVTVGLFWIVLGGLVGYFFDRFEDT